ncbi:phosphatidate cytidylyltransferase [Mycoplasmopsis mustelae]|uniref:Phosphatidate cytidylyltransferase n=1 Tax=Mycoplasmopsis mustelae TaxID=171289 RepID=A0A4R7UBV3_9BACT|nr:phosphatidate cytidylyltransferase [Mycoplasmopsis mustelae]TDV23035.1 phosphatidate cytidylyltransferase [Mycoplasmopsis mustelae]
MNQIQTNKPKKLMSQRVIPAGILTIFLVVLCVIVRYSFYWSLPLYNSNITLFWAIRVIAILLVTVLAFWLFYELNNSYLSHKIFATIQSFFSLGLLFVGLPFFAQVITNTDTELKNSVFTYLIWSDWQSHLLLFVLVVIYFIFRTLIVKDIAIKELLIKTLSYFLSLLFLDIFLKVFLYLNTIESGIEFIVWFILIATFYDMGGFFGGWLFGGKVFAKKMAPIISPKKTWEGALVGYISSLIISFIFIYSYYAAAKSYQISSDIGSLINNLGTNGAAIIAFLTIAPILALVGDLYFSLIKRQLGVKDFSNILKGHGGLLDRVDSVSFVFFGWSLFALIL